MFLLASVLVCLLTLRLSTNIKHLFLFSFMTDVNRFLEIPTLSCLLLPNKVEEKSQSESLQNRVGNIGCCQCGKYHAEMQEIDCICCKVLVELDELNFEGKLFYAVF